MSSTRFANYFNEVRKDYEEFCKNVSEDNKNIYDELTSAQIDATRKYSKLRTRDAFREIDGNLRLNISIDKLEKLKNITHGLTDWVYDGSIDTGYMGGGMCSLGHKLRYENIAVSESTGEKIVFGIVCASDFFNVEQSVLKNINNVIKETTEEIKFTMFIKETNRTLDYRYTLYGDLSEKCTDTMANLKLNEILGEYSAVTFEFMQLDIPLPKFLIDKIEVFNRWYDVDYENEKRYYDLQEELMDIDMSLCEHLDAVREGKMLDCGINKMLKSYGILDYNINKIVKCIEISKLLEDNKQVVTEFNSKVSKSYILGKRCVYTVSKNGYTRLATKFEVFERCLGVKLEEEYNFSERSRKMLLALKLCFDMDMNLVEQLANKKSSYVNVLCSNINQIKHIIKYISIKLDKIIDYINSLKRGIEYGVPTDEVPEITDEALFRDIFICLNEKIENGETEGMTPIAIDIVRKTGYVVKVSFKQGQVLRKCYNKLMCEGEEKPENTDLSQDISEYIDKNSNDVEYIVYIKDKDKVKFGVCLIDFNSKIVGCEIINIGDRISEKYNLSKCKNLLTYISAKEDKNWFKNFGDFDNKVKTFGFGKELSNKVIGDGWAKFKDIEQYVGFKNQQYSSIIKNMYKTNISKEDYYLVKNAVMLWLAFEKLKNKEEIKDG